MYLVAIESIIEEEKNRLWPELRIQEHANVPGERGNEKGILDIRGERAFTTILGSCVDLRSSANTEGAT